MSEPIGNNKTDDDFVGMGYNCLSAVNFKVAIFLFIFGMFIFSDLFIESFLSKFSDTVYGECTTTKGTIIQLTIFVLGYLVFDLLNKGGVI